jgi:hypothetical protein
MKKNFLLIAGLCISVFRVSAQEAPSRIEKKSFPDVKEIRFEHKYGNIAVTESDAGQVELEIQYFDGKKAKPAANTAVKGNVLEIETVIPRNDKPNRKKVGINYIVVVPKSVAMKVNLKYGNINMGDFHGDFTCNLHYGNLNANTFYSTPVHILSRYANVKIEEADALEISTDYANLNVNTINTLNAKSRYSKYQLGEAKIVEATCSYGNINIKSAVAFDAQLRYNPATIDNLDKKLNVQSSYSNVKINSSSKQLEAIKFNGHYANLTLKLDADLSANFNADLRYGKLSIDDKYKANYSFSETETHISAVKKGTIGKGTPTANISISNSYANVSIK